VAVLDDLGHVGLRSSAGWASRPRRRCGDLFSRDLGQLDGDRVDQPLLLAGLGDLAVVEARAGPQDHRTGRPRCAGRGPALGHRIAFSCNGSRNRVAWSPIGVFRVATCRKYRRVACLDHLGGYRIVDLTLMVSGPFATMLLADQGADVIKIEPFGLGDFIRQTGFRSGGIAAMFANLNRGKRSVTLATSWPINPLL
jgi:hypothetical protein